MDCWAKTSGIEQGVKRGRGQLLTLKHETPFDLCQLYHSIIVLSPYHEKIVTSEIAANGIA